MTHPGTRHGMARLLPHAARAVAPIGVVLTLGGCFLEEILGPRTSNPPMVWYTRLLDHDATRTLPPSPLLAGNAVVFGLSNSTIMARDPDTGRPLWTSTFDGRAIEGHRMHYVQGVVLAVSSSRAHGFDGATGHPLWTYDAPPSPWGALLPGGPGEQSYFGNSYTDADEETLFVPAWGGNISALDARTGARRWLWQFDSGQPDKSMAVGVRVSGDTLYAIVTSWTTANGMRTDPFLFALSTRSGRELWRLALPDTASGTSPWAQPVLAGGLVVVTGGTKLFGVDPATRTIRWTFVGPETGQVARYSPVARDGIVYLDNAWDTMSAVDGGTGRELWRRRLTINASGYPGDCVTSGDLAVSETHLYVPCQLWIMTLDRSTGRILAIRSVPKSQPGNDDVKGHVWSGLLTAGGMAIALIVDSRGLSSVWYAAAFREP